MLRNNRFFDSFCPESLYTVIVLVRQVWSNWRPSDLPRVEVRAGKDDTCGAEGREQKGGK